MLLKILKGKDQIVTETPPQTPPQTSAEKPAVPPSVAALQKKPSPASQSLGASIAAYDLAAQTVDMVFDAGPHLLNKFGALQGGMVTAMLDDVMSVTAALTAEWGTIVPTLEIKTSFFETAKPGRLTAKGRTIKRGKSIVFVAADLFDPEGTLVAAATGTFRLVALKKG